MTIKTFLDQFEEIFPPSLAYQWDNVGLQIGKTDTALHVVLLTLDVTMEVIQEAISHNCNLIISHHPILFHAIKQIDTSSYLGQMIETAIQAGITIYSAHTNLDVSPTGLNSILGTMLGLSNMYPIEYVTETEGLGIIGEMPNNVEMDDFIQHVKHCFQIESLQCIGSKKSIKHVALCGGSGSSLIPAVLESQADIYISGDITYHHALDAKNMGLTILDVGHSIERIVLPNIKQQLQIKNKDTVILVSTIDTNPYQKQ